MRLSPLPLLALAGGALLAAASGGLLGLLQAAAEANYAHQGFLDGFFQLGLVALVGGLVGAYAAVGTVWAWRDRERDVVPGLIALAIVLGGLVGPLVITTVFVLGHAPPALMMGQYLLGPVCAYLAGAWACRVQRPEPASRRMRAWRVAAVSVLVLGLTGALAYPRNTWPGGDAPIATRRAWAEATFGRAFVMAETYAKTHPAVTKRLGPVQAVAPMTGKNRTYTSPGEMAGDFTLELVGTQGHGELKLFFMHDSGEETLAAYGFEGLLSVKGEQVKLEGQTEVGAPPVLKPAPASRR